MCGCYLLALYGADFCDFHVLCVERSLCSLSTNPPNHIRLSLALGMTKIVMGAYACLHHYVVDYDSDDGGSSGGGGGNEDQITHVLPKANET